MRSKKQSRRKEQLLNTIPIFLAKTYRMVDNPQYNDIISWTEDGTAFIIHSLSRLINEVFPHHFKHNNLASFIRQLNMYGFRKQRSEEGQVYCHEFFRKDEIEQLKLIKRRCPEVESVEPLQPEASLAVMASTSDRDELQEEVQTLRAQHAELQNIVKLLAEQNSSITMQNRAYVAQIQEMKEKYRKKFETILLLLILGKNSSASEESSELQLPLQFQNILQAFELHNFDENTQLALPVPAKPTRRHKIDQPKMIKGQDFQWQQNNHSLTDSAYKQDSNNLHELVQVSSFDFEKEDREECLRSPKENGFKGNGEISNLLVRLDKRNSQSPADGVSEEENLEVPPSPSCSLKSYSCLQRPLRSSLSDEFMERINRSDYSQGEGSKKQDE